VDDRDRSKIHTYVGSTTLTRTVERLQLTGRVHLDIRPVIDQVSNDAGDAEAGQPAPVKPNECVSISNVSGDQPPVTRDELADRLRKSDRWMIALTAVIAIGGAISAVIFGLELYQMRVATELTRESLEISQRAIIQSREALIATQRAWLTLEASATGLAWQGGGTQLELTVTSKNTGLTPALYTRILAIMDLKIGGRKGSDICNSARTSDSKEFMTNVIFPGATLTQEKVAKVDPGELNALRLKDGSLRPTVTVCIDYRSALGEPNHHQTFMTFDLFRMHYAPDGHLRVDPKDGDLAASDIDLSHREGENFAD
jgi:hypothetical protein